MVACATGGGVVRLNLLDKAIRHARSTVAVELTLHDERVDVAISDDDPGYDPEQLPRMGERFHRPLGSVGPGSGFGLSIARAVVALRHGQIVPGRAATAGAEVVLRLPCVQSGVAQ